MEMTVVNIVLLVLFASLAIYAIYKANKIGNKAILESYQRLQQKYPSINFSKDRIEDSGSANKRMLEGTMAGMPFICCDIEERIGKNTTFWTTFEFEHGLNLENYELNLTSDFFYHKIGKSMSIIKEMEIGVKDFDKRFFIKTSDEAITKRILKVQNCEKLIKIPKLYFGKMIINNKILAYKMPCYLSTPEVYDYFINVLEFSQELLAELKHIKGKV